MMHRGRSTWLALLLTVAPLAPVVMATSMVGERVAHAEPSSGEKEAARKLMIRGLEERKSGSPREALESFRAADAIMHVPTTALEVARTQQQLGHWLDARDTATAALRQPARPNESAPFKEARAQMSALVEEITAKLPSVAVTITGAPPGTPTTVLLDGTELPAAALDSPRKVDPGHHVIDGKAGETVGHVEVDVPERQVTKVELMMRGGTATAESPAAPQASAPSAKKSGPLLPLEITGFAVGGAALVTGAVTGIISLSKTHSIRSSCGGDTCPADVYNSLDSDRSTAHTTATISTAAFIVAGVGAALGVTCLVLRSHKKAESSGASATSWVLAPGVFAGTF